MKSYTYNGEEVFLLRYQKLNRQQKEAVDAIEGPVIVNAGPGTGKTQILATRIGNILLNTDTPPHSILCLTYTDNGATEMRERLLQIVGTAAYSIRIHTFHSFCNEVIQDNLSYFGKLNLEPIGELEEIDLFNRLIDSIEKDNPLKRFRGDVYYESARLKNLFSLMKKEAWPVEYMEERIDAYLQSLPVKEGFFYKRKYKEFNAGDANPSKIAVETEKMELLRAAVKLYPRYNRMMADMSRYNFDDMILWVLAAFGRNKNMLLDYQEKFLYFLVDEFQDTSRSQNLLLHHLISYWDTPNVFVVGDADQSIFSFQDANVENIIHFENTYRDSIQKITLVNNYRSAQRILDTAHQLIIHNSVRTVSGSNDKSLIASNTALQQTENEPCIIQYPNTSHESMDVALQIERLVQQGISGKEIAVIYRNHAQVEEIIQILEAKKIPVNTRRKIDVLQLPFIRNIISLLQWIDKENTIPYSADDILFKLLHFNFFQLQPIEIARLSMSVNDKNVGRKEDRYSLRRLLTQMQVIGGDLFTPPDNRMKAISDTLEHLVKEANNLTVQHLAEKLIQKAGILNYIMQSADKPWLMQVLNAFFNYIKDASKRKPDISLHELLNNISLMQHNRIGIPLHKITASDDGVNLITAHGSKGSEYEHIFVIGCTENIWDEKNKGNSRTYSYPDNLQSNNNTSTDLEESRRLFYVAITRAKTHLYLSFAAKDKNARPQTRSTFITEIMESAQWPVTEKALPDDLLADLLALQFSEIAMPEIEIVENEYINQLLKRYTLSVTHLNNYLNCPLKFYYQNLIRVPSAKNESMVFGSATHFALQRLFEKMLKEEKVFPSKEAFLEDFNWFMQKNRDAFTPENFKRRMEYGEKILPAYYETHIGRWNRVVKVEHPIRHVSLGNVPLNGTLDKLEFNGKLVNVVDYKTGKYDNAKKKLLPPGEKEPEGGDYWRQAVFYKILMDNDKSHPDWQNMSTTFEFIEPVNNQYFTENLVIMANDITTVTQQIKTVWNKIQNREFKTGCGKADCEWCQFIKTNQLAVALHPPVDEDDSIEVLPVAIEIL